MGEFGKVEHRASSIEHRASSIEHRASSIEHLVLAICFVWLTPDVAAAQSFGYAAPVGTEWVPLVLDTTATPPTPAASIGPSFVPNEFLLDAGGLVQPDATADMVSWARQRIAANTRQRYRIIGNPLIRQVAIRFSHFAMNTTVTTDDLGSSADFVRLAWSNSSPVVLQGNPALANGHWPNPVAVSVGSSGTNSLMSPGMIFEVVTGPDIPETATMMVPDAESWGFEADRIEVSGGAMGAQTLPTLGVYDDTIAVLLPTNDTVRTLIAQTGHPTSILMWKPATSTTFQSGPVLWTRCGAAPTATQFDGVQFLVSPGRAILQQAPCPAGQSLHMAITNTSALAHAVRVFVSSNRSDRDRILDVGFSFNATPTQLAAARQQFRQAAWTFFGATGGSHIIRAYRFHNNSWCDAFPGTSCAGGNCDVCVRGNTGRASCNGASPARVWAFIADNYATYAHEFGHCFTQDNGQINGLRDEYRDLNCMGLTSFTTCAHSMMSLQGSDNRRGALCTAVNHWRTGVNFDVYGGPSATQFRSQWNDNQACGTVWRDHPWPSFFPQDAAWTWLDSRLVSSFPAGRTASVLPFEHFWTSSVMGRFDRLE